jgi:hypothetical protein
MPHVSNDMIARRNFGTPEQQTTVAIKSVKVAWQRVPTRKNANRNKDDGPLRFTPGDIVRAIAGVEAAGLPISAVEITPTSTIKISIGSRIEGSAGAPKNEAAANFEAQAKLTKKQA